MQKLYPPEKIIFGKGLRPGRKNLDLKKIKKNICMWLLLTME